jgi:hypothetical protein
VTFRQLADLVDERLDATERAEVAAATAADPDARATEHWLRGFVETARAIPLADASPLVEQRLRQHFARWAQAQEVLSAPTVRVRAELVFDSRRDRALAGVRGDTETVDLGYGCEQAELLVNLLPDRDGRVKVSGQVLLTAETTAPIFEVGVGAADGWRTAESDELGRFRLGGLPAARTELRLGNGEVEICAVLDLQDPAGDDSAGRQPPGT